ncbi:hypothetical protein LY78DRAFT_71247 [Colletotrichum sublineola]|nr:hypothetical protein LY78DRAFT_71247 [Colletotrichum sublineola]
MMLNRVCHELPIAAFQLCCRRTNACISRQWSECQPTFPRSGHLPSALCLSIPFSPSFCPDMANAPSNSLQIPTTLQSFQPNRRRFKQTTDYPRCLHWPICRDASRVDRDPFAGRRLRLFPITILMPKIANQNCSCLRRGGYRPAAVASIVSSQVTLHCVGIYVCLLALLSTPAAVVV